MPPRKQPQFVQVKEAASVRSPDEDGPTNLRRGEILAVDHPLVRSYPDLFKPLEPDRQRPKVEQMTAGPGEQRGDAA